MGIAAHLKINVRMGRATATQTLSASQDFVEIIIATHTNTNIIPHLTTAVLGDQVMRGSDTKMYRFFF